MTGERLTPPHWAELLETALTLEGASGGTYSRFRNLSITNQALLMMQSRVVEPQNTYKGWLSLSRQVKKGSKAKFIYVPMFRKERDEKGQVIEERLSGFRLVPCMFGVSETEGDDLPPWEPPTWSKDLAQEKLGIEQVPYDSVDGNAQGWSRGREYALNPVCRYPFKTTIHEWGHILAGHTTDEGMKEYRTHRGVMEFVAEGTAYLVLNELGALEQFDAAESRLYLQHWLRGETPDDVQIKRVLSVADKIVRAGREVVAVELEKAS